MSILKSALSLVLLSTLVLPTGCKSNTTVDPAEGFRPLFNGNDLSGWQYNKPKTEPFTGQLHSMDKRFSVVDGIFTVNPGKGIQKIWTTELFDTDFTLMLEFRAAVNADSGIYVRGPQLQCRDYSVAGPYRDLAEYKPQDWNQIVVEVEGRSVSATCNGVPIQFKTRNNQKPETGANIKKGKIPAKGPIGLEADRGQMEYRNIWIKTK